MPKGYGHKYTPEQHEFLVKRKAMKRKDLARLFNETFGLSLSDNAIKGYCKRHNIMTGRDGRMTPGNKPWNTGTKGVMKPNSGSFVKGQKPINAKPLGSERLCNKDGFILIKVAEKCPHTGRGTRYKLKHHVIWEQHNGPIPDGHAIRFKDGDKYNIVIDNLICVPLAVNLQMNRDHVNDLPFELVDTGIALATLKVATHSALKRNNHD